MLKQAKKIIAISVMALATAVISLPVALFAATSPAVTVLSPLQDGLGAPAKIAIDASGNIYVSDQRANGVVKYNTYGVKQCVIPVSPNVTAVALAQDGSLLVADSGVVLRYDVVTGKEISRFGQGQVKAVGGIAVDPLTGYVYVSDASSKQVSVFTASGSFVKVFGSSLFVSPAGIIFEKISRQLIVSDAMGNALHFFDADGVFVKSMGTVIPGGTTAIYSGLVAPMQFFTPVAVALEYSKDAAPVLSRMYVVTSFQSNLQVVDAASSTALLVAGTAKNFIGSPGAVNGQLMNPSDAVFDSVNSRLLVVNGFGNITIYGIDGGKNPVDVTPPVFTINPLSAEVSVNVLAVSGSVEAGSAVQVVSAEGASIGAVSYSGSSWSVVATGLVPGNNSFTVTAKDAAGNVAAPQVANVTYLVPAPSLSVSALPAVTNSSFLKISGTVDVGATVAITNQATSATVNANIVGDVWSYDVALSEGANNFTVTAQKPMSGKATTSVAVTLDTVPPLLSVSALADGSYTSTQVQNIAGTVSDSSLASVAVNGTAVEVVNSAFSVPLTLVSGINAVQVTATDLAGNVTSSSRNIYFDSTKPAIAIIAPMDNSFTNNPLLKVLGSTNKVATVTVNGVLATVAADNTWSADLQLLAGLNTIDVQATDLYGNSSTLKRSVVLDMTNPLLAVTSPTQDLATNKSLLVMTGTVSDSVATTVTWNIAGVTSAAVVDAGSFSFTANFAAEGTFPIQITATDSAGNSTTATRTVIYDKTPPLLIVDGLKSNAVKKLSGTVEAGAGVTVNSDNGKSCTAKIVGFKWSVSAGECGVKAFDTKSDEVRAVDAAGNVTTKKLKAGHDDHDDHHDDD